MRLGIGMVAALALLGCTSNDVPIPTGTTTSTSVDVTGTWTLTWGPMAGTFTVQDTVIVGPDTTITNRLVATTCTATGTMTVTQQTPIANVVGTYTITRTCSDTLVFPSTGADTIPAGVATVITDSVYRAVVTADNNLIFFLDKPPTATAPTPAAAPFKQGQEALVSGNGMTGVAVWANLMFKHAPKVPPARAVPLRGTFSATKP
jgi:hypothetical protein